MTANTILLDGNSLTREQLVAVARRGLRVVLDESQLVRVQRAADFLADKVSCGEPIYGVTTGFGSNADKLLGAHRVRDELPGGHPDNARGHAARRAAAQPDHHARRLRGQAVRGRRGARDAGRSASIR